MSVTDEALASVERARRFHRLEWYSVLVGLLVLVVLVGGYAIFQRQGDLATSANRQTQILQALRQAETQRDQQAAADAETAKHQTQQSSLAFAVILENLAAAFGTPPAPDPGRLKAVTGLCDTAAAFRMAAGDTHPPPCPAL